MQYLYLFLCFNLSLPSHQLKHLSQVLSPLWIQAQWPFTLPSRCIDQRPWEGSQLLAASCWKGNQPLSSACRAGYLHAFQTSSPLKVPIDFLESFEQKR